MLEPIIETPTKDEACRDRTRPDSGDGDVHDNIHGRRNRHRHAREPIVHVMKRRGTDFMSAIFDDMMIACKSLTTAVVSAKLSRLCIALKCHVWLFFKLVMIDIVW